MPVTSQSGQKIISKTIIFFMNFFMVTRDRGLERFTSCGIGWTALIANLLLELDED